MNSSEPEGEKYLKEMYPYRYRIMDEAAVRRALARIAHEIIERNQGVEKLCILGVKSRGISLSKTLSENIFTVEGKMVPVGHLDITLHRDDISDADKARHMNECAIPCDITGKNVVIVDDVLYTGRSVRAAIEAVFAYGRPRSVQLAVLVDRGHRELPIRADYVGKNVPTSGDERVAVMTLCDDGESAVYIERTRP